MSDMDFFTGSHNPIDFFRSMFFQLRFMRDNPTYFYPDGLWVFCGAQGQGKTLSAVQTVLKLCKDYPKAILCSNLDIKGVDRPIIPFTDYMQIQQLDNGIEGVIFLIDEIQAVWNCMESREVPIEELATLCMNRKARRVVIGTSQVYGRVTKAIREQYKYVVLCHKYFGYLQINKVVDPCPDGYTNEDDGHFEGQVLKTSIWFHSPAAYLAYDTYKKIPRPDRKQKKVLKGGYL